MSHPSYEQLASKYRPVFARIAEGVRERERDRVLPTQQIMWLKEAGFPGLRVPRELGGDGASLPQLFRLLVELSSVDPHIPQAFRGHIAFVEDRLYAPDSAERTAWLSRFARGEMVGNAVTEIGAVALGDVRTKLTQSESGLTITGSKYYTTGSIFAEWIDTWCANVDGVEVAALVSTHSPTVTISDDWTGFGQRLTGSGTVVFAQAPVDVAHVFPWSERFPFQTALYQLVLVAVSAGIARASVNDAILQVQTRARTFSHGNTAQVRNDPQILESIGRLAATATSAESLVVYAAHALQHSADARGADLATVNDLKQRGEILSAEAQIIGTRASLEASTYLFEGLGASATDSKHLLDRHWRNARTVATHNPVPFKARIVGDWLVNDVEPPYEWAIGVGVSSSPEKG